MALPQKGSRKIVVDGIAYRWTIRKKPSYDQALCASSLTAAAELYVDPASTLSIEFKGFRADNWMQEEGLAIGPKEIAQAIRQALQAGWQAEEHGPTFSISCEP
ncbi:hypothetical protein SAMN02745181_0242 [Rubritalea squalenifaciens DSM 18772]|uniref:Uncharacterized protein n=1 Tax=Rubritalea squalenifaciens DSM 18772 TaxID=1123071 RepID=A0A1M6BJT2_9BACT|nr:hypothetical protein [Rubritalea squalenifaciens]SHI49040.1 hypothetical protein SAMN02745181_0242 [Rubritalea squalenifaciens DSM 18772]